MSEQSAIYVTVQLVRGGLELATTTHEEVEGILYPSGGSRLGVVLKDSKKHLAIEESAVPVLKRLFDEAACDGDGFGDIDWCRSKDGSRVFSWLGPNEVRWNPVTFGQADRASGASFQKGAYRVLTAAEFKAVNAATKATKKKKRIRRVTTQMIEWRGGQMEFVCQSCQWGEKATQPPWYIVEISGGVWRDEKWYSWIDYRGPPKVFLTRRFAVEHARSMREQYKCRARVIRIGPLGKEAL